MIVDFNKCRQVEGEVNPVMMYKTYDKIDRSTDAAPPWIIYKLYPCCIPMETRIQFVLQDGVGGLDAHMEFTFREQI